MGYVASRNEDEYSAFILFFLSRNSKIILTNRNIERKDVFCDTWKKFNTFELEACIGLWLLSGVYKSHNESTENLWDASTRRNIFRATMSLENF